MGGQILGAMPENLAPCLSLHEIGFLGSGEKKKALRFTSECFQYTKKLNIKLWLMLLLLHYLCSCIKYNKT